MPSRDTPNPPGAQRRGVAEPLARRERRVKAKAAPAGARSASLEAAQAPCKTLDAQHSRLVLNLFLYRPNNFPLSRVINSRTGPRAIIILTRGLNS